MWQLSAPFVKKLDLLQLELNLVLLKQPLPGMLDWYYSDLLQLIDFYIDWQKKNTKSDT